jgi:hypothetical protein
MMNVGVLWKLQQISEWNGTAVTGHIVATDGRESTVVWAVAHIRDELADCPSGLWRLLRDTVQM